MFEKKEPVEWIIEGSEFIDRVETRYIEDGERTKSSGAVRKGDTEARNRMLQRQLAGDTPTEPYEREVHKVLRKGREEGGTGHLMPEATPKQKERFQQ